MRFKNPEKVVKITVIALAIYLVAFGLAMAFFPIRPFWNDEWRLIYNLKFKSTAQLWGRLDLLQECPRVYLTLLKLVTSFFDYSYIALRTPALVLSILNIFFLFSLRKKLFGSNNIYSYLFVLILISSQTFTDYMVQVKHYEMEIFATLVALWQLISLLKISEEGMQRNKGNYLLLCISCMVVPFFSYTYPIAVAPVFPVILFHLIVAKKEQTSNKRLSLFAMLLPLVLLAISILIFYLVDVKQVMTNQRMYQSYLHVLHNDSGEKRYLADAWYLFALVGSGFVYEIVLGILGIAAFLYSLYRLAAVKKQAYHKEDLLLLYSIILIFLTIFLLVTGKIIGGVARLTSFTVPAIAIMIVFFLGRLKNNKRYRIVSYLVAIVLFLGLTGNIISSCIGNFTYVEYKNRLMTYLNTEKAIKEARQEKIPVMYTAAIDGDIRNDSAATPGKIKTNTITREQIAGVDTLCGEVILKVSPAYETWDPIPVYEMPDTKWLNNYVQQLPQQYNSALVFDGTTYKKMLR